MPRAVLSDHAVYRCSAYQPPWSVSHHWKLWGYSWIERMDWMVLYLQTPPQSAPCLAPRKGPVAPARAMSLYPWRFKGTSTSRNGERATGRTT
ncbi:hypothetical protein FOXYSP1_01522 [Fusarium oxysporum f. sp. phaseoli]